MDKEKVFVYTVEIRIKGKYTPDDDECTDRETRDKLEGALKDLDYKILDVWIDG